MNFQIAQEVQMALAVVVIKKGSLPKNNRQISQTRIKNKKEDGCLEQPSS